MFFPLATESKSYLLKSLNRILFVLGVLLFKISLDYFYEIYGPLFTYLGLIIKPQSDWIQVFVYLMVLLTATIIPIKHRKPSNMFLVLLYLMSYIPVCTVYSYNDTASDYAFYAYSFLIISLSILNYISFPFFKTQIKTLSTKHFYILLSILIIGSLAILISKYGLKFNVKNYDAIYDVREAFKTETNGSRLFVFSFNWLSHVFTVFLLIIAIYKKKLVYIGLALVVQLYLFNLGGNKSIFLIPAFAIFVYVGLVYFKEYAASFFAFSLLFMSASLYFYDFVINDSFSVISSILIRRNFFVPANIYFHYVDYFSYNPHDVMARSFPFNLFLDSFYSKPIPLTIGTEYINRFGKTFANGNFLADLFFNFGWFGFIFAFFLFGVLLKIVDAVSDNRNFLIITPIFIVPIVSIMNSGIMVNLISYGFFVIILLVAVFPKIKFYAQK